MCGARANFRATAREHQKLSAACRQIYGRAILEDDSQLEVIISCSRSRAHQVEITFFCGLFFPHQGYQERVSVRTVSV